MTSKRFQMQPITLITRAQCDYIQGRIIECVSIYPYEDSKRNLDTCIQCAEWGIDLLPQENANYLNLGLGYSYARVNNLNKEQTEVVIAALQRDYLAVIRFCEVLLKKMY